MHVCMSLRAVISWQHTDRLIVVWVCVCLSLLLLRIVSLMLIICAIAFWGKRQATFFYYYLLRWRWPCVFSKQRGTRSRSRRHKSANTACANLRYAFCFIFLLFWDCAAEFVAAKSVIELWTKQKQKKQQKYQFRECSVMNARRECKSWLCVCVCVHRHLSLCLYLCQRAFCYALNRKKKAFHILLALSLSPIPSLCLSFAKKRKCLNFYCCRFYFVANQQKQQQNAYKVFLVPKNQETGTYTYIHTVVKRDWETHTYTHNMPITKNVFLL